MVFLGEFCWSFQTAYEQVSRGGEAISPPKTTSFKQWAERLQVLPVSSAARAGLLAGRATKTGRSLARRLFWGENTVAADTVSVSLNQKETQLYCSKFRRLITPRLMMYCSQPGASFAEWTGESKRCWWIKKDTDGRTFSTM